MSLKREHVVAGVFFAGVGLWLIWPQVVLTGTAIVGGHIAETDGWQNVWNLWWVRTAVLNWQNPLYTNLLFWPQGVSLGFQTLNITNALVTLPVLLVASPLAAYSIAALLGFVLSGITTYLLAWHVLQPTTDNQQHLSPWAAALLAGLIVEVAPPHLARFLDGQLEHVTLQWIPLYILALWLAIRQPTYRSGVWVGLCAALVAYTSWYHALHLALLTATWGIWHIVFLHKTTSAQYGQTGEQEKIFWESLKAWVIDITFKHFRPWVVALPLIVVLLAPVFFGFIMGYSNAARDAAHWNTQAEYYRIDVVDLLLPSANHPLWGSIVREYQQSIHPLGGTWIVTPGFIAFALVIGGIVFSWKHTKLWTLTAAVFLCYGFGASLQINGQDTGIPLPFALISFIPGANFGHRRNLVILVTLVVCAVIAAFAVRAILARLRGWRHLAVFATLVAGILMECAPPQMTIFRNEPSPIYAKIRNTPGALLIVPIGGTSQSKMGATMRDQMVHGRPIIGGYVAKPPNYPLLHIPMFDQLNRRACERLTIVPQDRNTMQAILAYYHITQVVLHAERLSPRGFACAKAFIEHGIGFAPAFQEGTVTVYDVEHRTPQPFLFPSNGWYAVEHDAQRTWSWMKERGTWYLVNPDSSQRVFALHMRMQSIAEPRVVALSLDQHHIGRITVFPNHSRIYTIFVTLTPGQHTLHMESSVVADPDPLIERKMSIAVEDATIVQVR